MSQPLSFRYRLLRKLRDAMNSPPTRRQRRWAMIRALAQESAEPRSEARDTTASRVAPPEAAARSRG